MTTLIIPNTMQAVAFTLAKGAEEARILAWIDAGNTGPMPEHADNGNCFAGLFEGGENMVPAYDRKIHADMLAQCILDSQRHALGIYVTGDTTFEPGDDWHRH